MGNLNSLDFCFEVLKRTRICSLPGRLYRAGLVHGDFVVGGFDVTPVHSFYRWSMAVEIVSSSVHRTRTAANAFHIHQSVDPTPLTGDMILPVHVL